MKKCSTCGSFFSLKNFNKKFCCNLEALKFVNPDHRFCKVCNSIYKPKSHNSLYCSKECKLEAARIREKQGPERKCRHCGKIYKRRRERGGFCSTSCASKHLHTTPASNNSKRNLIPSNTNKEKRARTMMLRYGSLSTNAMRRNLGADSKIQQKVFERIQESFERRFFYHYPIEVEGGLVKFVDIYDKETETVIEMHGSYWHTDPSQYKPDYVHPHRKITAREIWNKDAERRSLLESIGKTVVVVWEDDFKKYEEDVIKELVNALSKK